MIVFFRCPKEKQKKIKVGICLKKMHAFSEVCRQHKFNLKEEEMFA